VVKPKRVGRSAYSRAAGGANALLAASLRATMNGTEIRQALLSLVGFDFPAGDNTAILYGSRRPGRDIDILVVLNCAPPVPTAVLGYLDLLMFGRDYFDTALSLFDPVVVEPVLTGELLFGNEQFLADWRKQVTCGHPGKDSVNYLLARSVTELVSSRHILNGDTGVGEYVKWSFQNLSFSIAYASFAKRYAKADSTPCTLNDLVRDGQAYLPGFWRFRDEVRGGARLGPDTVQRWLDEWSRCLIIHSP